MRGLECGSPEGGDSWVNEFYLRPVRLVRKPCLKGDLAMMLESSSEDESQEETSDISPGAVLKKELLSYRNKKRINVSESPLNW